MEKEIRNEYFEFVQRGSKGRKSKKAESYRRAIDLLNRWFAARRPDWAPVDVWTLRRADAVVSLMNHVKDESASFKKKKAGVFSHVKTATSYLMGGHCTYALKAFAEFLSERDAAEERQDGESVSMSDFRLVALYVGNYECFRNQMFNLCTDYRISRGRKQGKVQTFKIDRSNDLPDNFFSLKGDNGLVGTVQSVSAIVGKNGTGKTTIARALYTLAACDTRKGDNQIALFYESEGSLKCYSTMRFEDLRFVDANGVSVRVANGVQEYQMIYFSPHYTTEQSDTYCTSDHADHGLYGNGDVYHNISTTYLMSNPEGNSELLPRTGVDLLHLFNVDEKIRLMEFLSAYNDRFRWDGKLKSPGTSSGFCHGGEDFAKFEIPRPKHICVAVHEEGVSSGLNRIKDYVEKIRNDESGPQKKVYERMLNAPGELHDLKGEYLRKILHPLEVGFESADFFVRAFIAYSVKYVEECGILNPSFSDSELARGGFLDNLLHFISCREWSKDRLIRQSITEFLERNQPRTPSVLISVNDEGRFGVSKACLAFKQLEVLCNRDDCIFDGSRAIRFRMRYSMYGGVQMVNAICRLIRLHSESEVISPYLKFDVLPKMSSGEMCFLSLYSRLYRVMQRIEAVAKGSARNLIVYLDEAETTLHPEWQKRLVEQIILFFEVFFPECRVNLIFASHSPMLLSDLPAGNVVRLQKNAQGRREVCKKTAGNSFAANVYDLLADSFFLEGGPIGQFARCKIRSLKEKWDPKIVKLIGDRVLVRLLEEGQNEKD